jgi:hypothetical protein
MIQHIAEDGSTRSLKEFADLAIKHLEENPLDEEVVQLADHITELAHDSMTRPDVIYPVPEEYRYRFSGFWGQVIAVARKGVV